MAKHDLTAEELRKALHYDPQTGLFTRKVQAGSARVGDVAGGLHKATGYVIVSVRGKPYLAHRLAWLYTHGSWPESIIDHRDHNKANNRILNLRDVSMSRNIQNLAGPRVDNKVGALGVSMDKRCGSFRANIFVAGRQVSLGYHKTIEAASSAYLAAKRALHEGCEL